MAIESGGQSTSRILTSALAEARRRARLTGRELSAAETEGLTREHFRGAESRLATRKGLGLQERGLDIQEALGYAGLKTTKRGQDIGRALGYAGLKTTERGQDIGLKASKYGANVGAATARYQTGKTSGFFGGGGFLGLGEGSIMNPAGYCIIITACTTANSYEVNITREYRDKVLSSVTLGGYYALCPFVVPFILKYRRFKQFVKKVLVDRLVDQFEWYLGYKPKRQLCTSRFVTKYFLKLCRFIGRRVNKDFWLTVHR